MNLVLFPRQLEIAMQEMFWFFFLVFFWLDKECCKKAKMLVTLITRLLIGIIFMQVLGEHIPQGRCSIAVILQFAELLIASKNGAA